MTQSKPPSGKLNALDLTIFIIYWHKKGYYSDQATQAFHPSFYLVSISLFYPGSKQKRTFNCFGFYEMLLNSRDFYSKFGLSQKQSNDCFSVIHNCCLYARFNNTLLTIIIKTGFFKGRLDILTQARRQDRMTGGGAEINFGGAREVYSSVDQTKKVKTKKKAFSTNIFTNSGYRLKRLAIFHKFLSEDQKKGLRPKGFMKSGVSPQKLWKNSSCSRILWR